MVKSASTTDRGCIGAGVSRRDSIARVLTLAGCLAATTAAFGQAGNASGGARAHLSSAQPPGGGRRRHHLGRCGLGNRHGLLRRGAPLRTRGGGRDGAVHRVPAPLNRRLRRLRSRVFRLNPRVETENLRVGTLNPAVDTLLPGGLRRRTGGLDGSTGGLEGSRRGLGGSSSGSTVFSRGLSGCAGGLTGPNRLRGRSAAPCSPLQAPYVLGFGDRVGAPAYSLLPPAPGSEARAAGRMSRSHSENSPFLSPIPPTKPP